MTTRQRHLHALPDSPVASRSTETAEDAAGTELAAVSSIVAEAESLFGGTVTSQTRALMVALLGGAK